MSLENKCNEYNEYITLSVKFTDFQGGHFFFEENYILETFVE